VSINFKPSIIFFMLGDLKGTTGVILGKYQEYWGSTCREAWGSAEKYWGKNRRSARGVL